MTLRSALRHAPPALLLALLAVPAFGQELDSPQYQELDREAKRALVWEAIKKDPYPADKLPTKGVITSALKLVWGRFSLRPTFDDTLDVRPARNKTFHKWGTSVAVRWEPVQQGITGALLTQANAADHPYTGVFKEGTVGIARLSLGLGNIKKLWAPGIGLKLFVDGKPSVNIHAIPKDGGQPTQNFMAATLDTKINPTPLDGFLKWSTKADPTHRKTDHVAAVTAEGEAVENPKSPFRLEFRPNQKIDYRGTPDWGVEDFRTSLARIPAGTVIYEVWAVGAEGEEAKHIGNIRTESEFVASDFQDRRFHFKHVR